MRIGIIGLPASGKTTVFELLTRAKVDAGGRHAVDPSIAVVKVPDPRLDLLAALYKAPKVSPIIIEFVDFFGLTRGSGKGDGLGGPVVTQMRQVDALLEVIRAFRDERVAHVEGRVDPARDAALVDAELLLADLEVVEKRIGRIEDAGRKGRQEASPAEREALAKARAALEAGAPVRDVDLSDDEAKALRGFQLLTAKPRLLLLNLDEAELGRAGARLADLKAQAGHRRTALLGLCAKVEREIADLDPEAAAAFRADLGLPADRPSQLIRACFDLLEIQTFLTANAEEARAWAVPRGTTALHAAGTVHSDMEHGFIRAEVLAFADLKAAGSLAAARKKGLLRLEGRDYLVREGDILHIRFSP
jgi:GTP-binding protein YchF